MLSPIYTVTIVLTEREAELICTILGQTDWDAGALHNVLLDVHECNTYMVGANKIRKAIGFPEKRTITMKDVNEANR